MTPLEAAQRLMKEDGPLAEDSFCRLCQRIIRGFADVEPQGHADTCPWLCLPRILAVVKVAERLINEVGAPYFYSHGGNEICRFCARLRTVSHASDCNWQALVVALRELS